MRKPPPGPGPGRPKGLQNKTTLAAKEAIQAAFDGMGGFKAMMEWAQASNDNKRVFYGSIYPKILPHEITGAGGKPISIMLMPLDATA